MSFESTGNATLLKLRQTSQRHVHTSHGREVTSKTKIQRPVKSALVNNYIVPKFQFCGEIDTSDRELQALSVNNHALGMQIRQNGAVEDKIDINITDSDLDTSFEDSEEIKPTLKFSSGQIYASSCRDESLAPVQTFQRQMEEVTCNISNCLLGPRDMKPIAVALINNFRIQLLDISGNFIGSIGAMYIADALKDNVYISELRMSTVDMGRKGLQYLVQALTENKTIRQLDISGNNIGTLESPLISQLIQNQKSLQTLNLSHNCLDDKGGAEIAKSLGENVFLKSIDISWNHLRMKGAEEICKAIGENISLEDVNLSWNGLGDVGMKALRHSLAENRMLKILNISNCRIDFFNLTDLLNGVMENEELVTLDMGLNPITSTGTIAVLEAIQKSKVTKINHLYLTDIPVNGDFVKLLLELQDTHPIFVRHPYPNKKKVKLPYRKRSLKEFDPSLILFECMERENCRLVDIFRTFDIDCSNYITREEIQDGFTALNIPLTERSLRQLQVSLDPEEDKEIQYRELSLGRRKTKKLVAKKEKDEDWIKMTTNLKNIITEVMSEKQQAKMNRKFVCRHSSLTILFKEE